DLHVFLRWCAEHHLEPLAAVRVDIERYVRWLQDVGCYQPSTVSRRLLVVVGFYRVCVIDQIMPHSPADYVRRPTVPAESPPSASDIFSSKPCSPRPGCRPTSTTSPSSRCSVCSACGSSKPAGPAS